MCLSRACFGKQSTVPQENRIADEGNHDFIFTLTETVALQRIDAGLIKHKLRLDRLDDTWQVRRHGLQVAVIARTLLKVDVLVAI